MRANSLTVEALRAIDLKWQRKRNTPGKISYSAAERQARFANHREAQYFRYVPCPLCGEDRYTVFHRPAALGWRALATLLARIIGVRVVSAILSTILRRPVDLSAKRYTVVRCWHCGFLYRNPTYTEGGLQRAYGNTYARFLTGEYNTQRRALYQHIYDRADLVRRTQHFSRRRLLDFGCGFGLFLDFMRSKGWEPYGFDFASDCVDIAKREFGLAQVRAGTLDRNTFDCDFDAVSFISVVAHLTNPAATFAQVHKILRPGGLVLIWTVNANSLLHRVRGARWTGFTPNHLVFFDPDSITRALTKAGFSRVDFGYDDRLFQRLVRDGTIPEECGEPVQREFEAQNLGDMQLVIATR